MGRVQVICDFRNYNYWTGNAIGFRASRELCSNFLLFRFVVLFFRYNKTDSDWCHWSSLKIFCPQFVKCFPWPLALRKHFMNFWQKIFNDDLDASHYCIMSYSLISCQICLGMRGWFVKTLTRRPYLTALNWSRSCSIVILLNSDARSHTFCSTCALFFTPWAIKNVALYFCLYLHKLLTDFQNSFTGTLCRQFAIMWLLYIPPSNTCISVLPCEI